MRKMIFVLALAIIFSGCFNKPAEKPAIKVDNISISAEDFQKAYDALAFSNFSMVKKQDFLQTFIDRKLILREAEALGLDKDPEFLQDIQAFWEQSLLKRVLKRKTIDLQKQITVSEKEISDFYTKYKDTEYVSKSLAEIKDQIKGLILREKQQAAIQEWVKSLERKSKIEIDYKKLNLPQQK